MGEALEIAETRCNTLKQQLDIMKKLYKSKTDNADDAKSMGKEFAEYQESLEPRPTYMIRQQCQAPIRTDTSGAAVVTINNILNGITTSINRLSELHNCMDEDAKSPVYKAKVVMGSHPTSVMYNTEKKSSLDCAVDVISRTSTLNKTKVSKKRAKKRSVVALNKSMDHLDRKPKSTKKPAAKDLVKTKVQTKLEDSTVILRKKKYVRKIKPRYDMSGKPSREGLSVTNLVELYLNKAANETDSDEEKNKNNNNNNRTSNETSFLNVECNVEVKPKLRTTEIKLEPQKVPTEVKYFEVPNDVVLSTIEEDVNRPCEFVGYNHNYEVPTIASKMKQVAKGFFRQYKFQTIPFCAATSTSPSHNIGLNIQQVMSIIKTRLPLHGISPTLAHNIGLAAEKMQNTPLSDIISSLESRIRYNCNYMQCPLSRGQPINYQEMQDMAATIPENQPADYLDNSGINDPNRGDGDLKNENMWSIDPATRPNCTCIPQQGMPFHQVVNKFQNSYQPVYFAESQYSQKISEQAAKRFKHIKSVYSQMNGNQMQSVNKKTDGVPFRGKEQVLRDVLCNLHEDFSKLTKKYDDLSQQINGNDGDEVDETTIKQLCSLEKKLSDKEAEIQMVMSLYKEVAALKEQVQELRKKASIASVAIEKHEEVLEQNHAGVDNTVGVPIYSEDNKGTKAALHLTRLLKQIQTYQECNRIYSRK